MLSDNILERLICFTDEEIDNLNGLKKIDQTIFHNERKMVVDCNKLLEPNQQISVRKHARFCEYPVHRHNYIELMYVYGGKMTQIINGNVVEINQGELLLLNQNSSHSIMYCSENDIIFNFIIKPEFLDYLSLLMDKEDTVLSFIFESLYSYKNNNDFLVFKSGDNATIRDYIDIIITCIYEPQIENNLKLKLLVGLLLSELMKYPEEIETFAEDCYEKLLTSSILKYILTNYQEGSLAVLSKQLHQPDYKICKLIKKVTGRTFKQLIQDERLRVADNLLKTTKMTVMDIMLVVGYENITYFYKIFKDKYNMTPSQLRESSLKQIKIVEKTNSVVNIIS